MRLIIINSLLFLATTVTFAAPVTLSNHDDSISLYKSLQGEGDKNAVVSGSSSSTRTIPHTPAPGPGSDDQAFLVRRAPHPPPVWKDGLPGARKTSGIRSVSRAGNWSRLGLALSNRLKTTRTGQQLRKPFKKIPIIRTARTGQRRLNYNKSPIVRNLDKTTRTGQQLRKPFSKIPITNLVRTARTGQQRPSYNKSPSVRNLDKTARTGQQRPGYNKVPIVRNLDKTTRTGQQPVNFNKRPITSPNKLSNAASKHN